MQLTRLRTTVRRIPWQRTAVAGCCLGISLIIGNALGVLISTVFGVSWLFMARYSNQSDTSYRPWHEQGVGRRMEKTGVALRGRQAATRSAVERNRVRIPAAMITWQNLIEWPVLAGVVLLGLSGWVVKVVITDDRPGRTLLGDFIYAYWPLQPYECLLAGLAFAGSGSLLIGWSAPVRWLLLQWLHRAGFSRALSMVSRGLRTGPVAAKGGGNEVAAASSAYPATSGTKSFVRSAAAAIGDHHGI